MSHRTLVLQVLCSRADEPALMTSFFFFACSCYFHVCQDAFVSKPQKIENISCTADELHITSKFGRIRIRCAMLINYFVAPGNDTTGTHRRMPQDNGNKD